jgi:hypothetical protein
VIVHYYYSNLASTFKDKSSRAYQRRQNRWDRDRREHSDGDGGAGGNEDDHEERQAGAGAGAGAGDDDDDTGEAGGDADADQENAFGRRQSDQSRPGRGSEDEGDPDSGECRDYFPRSNCLPSHRK